MQDIQLGSVRVFITHKDIKNVHLSVYPPEGTVRVSAPNAMDSEKLKSFILSKMNWIKTQQRKMKSQERESKREYVNKESHYFNGDRYLLKVVEVDSKPCVSLNHNELILQVRPNSTVKKKHEVMSNWYRDYLKQSIPSIIKKYEPVMDVKVNSFGVKRMKTLWGSCVPASSKIWLNLELAKKPKKCLEYIVVHEMVHLLEPTHNERFVALMNKFMPKWRLYRDELNKLPVKHEHWKY